jgi:hypothetical protein
MPRYLHIEHLKVLSSRLADWEAKMEDVIRLVENGSTELVQIN